jgi:hypothetical protein
MTCQARLSFDEKHMKSALDHSGRPFFILIHRNFMFIGPEKDDLVPRDGDSALGFRNSQAACLVAPGVRGMDLQKGSDSRGE